MGIKFRAWESDEKKMHKDVIPMYRDGKLENIIFDYHNTGYDFTDIEITYCDTVFLYEDNPYKIMQFTGLKDKNGVEIYEGDVIQSYDGSDAIIPDKFTVERDNFYTGFSPFNRDEGAANRHSMEVIGNIYQNPELLEVSE